MKQIIAVSIAQFLLASSILARTFTIRNNCPFTIWPAHFTNPDSPTKLTSQVAGWDAPARSQKSFQVPDRWAGRFWGRRNCDFSKQGPSSCATGGCNGGLICDARTGSGVPPATLAEFKLNGDGGKDYYDVSNVDGSNLPVLISNNKGCPSPSCRVDLNPGCPEDRMKVKDGRGTTIGCLSACQANLDGNHGNSANCCTGSHGKPETCPKTGVKHYDYFKGKCPDAYAYAYDESSQSALWTCNKGADYTVTFCP
ncbi:hypothetical protein PGT21_015537 [Puccinia graminis f. sp. tritici]|uniref:Thaumatin-like protein 1 n=1 Tax=Puccinia graminis f. sp. tritici TaxID=56615 RepID=A0A5B0PXN6_PUCGR|nr:hypothetical protein PGT21_015537 [Puccinia graminis f. sp. tritici]